MSSDKQTVKNQRYEILNYANEKDIKVEKWIEETVSGTKKIADRELGRLLKKLKEKDVSVAAIARIYGVNRITVKSFIEKRG